MYFQAIVCHPPLVHPPSMRSQSTSCCSLDVEMMFKIKRYNNHSSNYWFGLNSPQNNESLFVFLAVIEFD
jgi:hypothetical protein